MRSVSESAVGAKNR